MFTREDRQKLDAVLASLGTPRDTATSLHRKVDHLESGHTLIGVALTRIREDLAALTLPPAPQGGGFRWSVGRPAQKVPTMALDVTCTNEEKVPVTAAPVTSTGKPAKLDGPVVFEVTSGTGTVVQIDDTSAFLVSGDDPGDTTILVKADADLGAGVVEVSDTITLHVAGALATSLGLTAGAAVPK